MFLGLALKLSDQQRSYDLASQAFDELRSPVALLVRAFTESVLALDTDEFRHAESAVADAEAARRLLRNSPNAANVSLFCSQQARQRALNRGDNKLANHYEILARATAVELVNNHPSYAYGQWTAGWFYDAMDDELNARACFERAISSRFSKSYPADYALYLVRHHDMPAANRVMAQFPLGDSIFTGLTLSEIDSERARSRQILLAQIPRTIPYLMTRGLGTLFVLGYGQEAKELAKKLLSKSEKPGDFYHEILFHYVNGQNEQRVMSSAGTGRLNLCYANLALAEYEIGRGEFTPAKEYLLKSTKLDGFDACDRAKALYKRILSSDWPEWWRAEANKPNESAKPNRDAP